VSLLNQAKKSVNSNHRGSLDIIADILDASGGQVKKTYLMYRCNLSFRQLKYYLSFLLNQDLLSEVGPNGSSSHELFEVTDKGREYLRAYRSLMSLMS